MGRSAVIYVIGLTLIVGIALNNITHNSERSADTYTAYYGSTEVHNIAVSGANVGSSLLQRAGGGMGNFGLSFSGGYDTVIYSSDSSTPPRVTLLSASMMNLVNPGNPDGLIFRDTVQAVFNRVQFARYSWFTEKEVNGYVDSGGHAGGFSGASDYKITGDSVFGPAHTNHWFNLSGTPYFNDLVTALDNSHWLGPPSPDSVIFHGGFQSGIQITRPSTAKLEADMQSAVTVGLGGKLGYAYDGAGAQDISLTFLNNQVRIQVPPSGSLQDTTMLISDFSPNGVVLVTNADLHIKGTYSGALTVAAFGGTTDPNKGNVWIDGDVVAQTNPVGNPASPDMLGIVAGRMVYITEDDSRTTSSELTIQAAVYCQTGELTAYNFSSILPSGTVNLFGGVTQRTAGSLGVFNPGPPLSLLHGFHYNIRNDNRLATRQPPMFPYSDSFELASWWEN